MSQNSAKMVGFDISVVEPLKSPASELTNN